MVEQPRVIICIPIYNDQDMLPRCLSALSVQTMSRAFEVLLFLNNCTDASEEIAVRMQPDLPYRLHVVVQTLPAAFANAGHVRRLAMRLAAGMVHPSGVLLTTDADGAALPDWLAVNLAEIDEGADVVAGMAVIDPADVACVRARLAAEERDCAVLADLLDEIDWLIDPDPVDPWPRHTQRSGASIAVRATAFAEVGGIPATKIAEDRAFLDILRRSDASIRHSRDAQVIVSGRIRGRAEGGMADTLRRRSRRPDAWLDPVVEPPQDRLRRARARRLFRALREEPASGGLLQDASDALRVPAEAVAAALAHPGFGGGWAYLEAASPILRPRLVRTRDLARMIALARVVVQDLSAGRTEDRHSPHSGTGECGHLALAAE